jgi:hypothetical protein
MKEYITAKAERKEYNLKVAAMIASNSMIKKD